MKLTTNRVYELSLKVSIGVAILGILFRIQHYPGGDLLLNTGAVLSFVYIIIGIIKVIKDSSIDLLYKVLWILGFIVVAPIIGFIYLYKKMKKR